MAILQKEIFIQAPIEEVFEFVADTPKLAEVWPSLRIVKSWERNEEGLAKFDYEYLMAGMTFRGTNVDLEYVPNQKIVTKSTTGLDSTITWQFSPQPQGTLVTFTAEYKVPVPLIGPMAENVIVSMNNMDIELLLSTLKRRLES
ncbi:MAG: SRPBCC family protein [Anaerolineales bacterium]|nr:SRPBCC family protein [Anaerolineales bacterium]